MNRFEGLTEEEINILRSNRILNSIYPDAPDYYTEKRNKLLSFIPDCLSSLFYGDRKECEEVSREDVDYLFKNELISKEEIIESFTKAINEL